MQMRSVACIGIAVAALRGTTLPAQTQARTCAAPQRQWLDDTPWYTAFAQQQELHTALTAADIRDKLVGRYDFIVITTEGTSTHTVERSSLRLLPTDSSVTNRCSFGRPCRPGFSYPLVGYAGKALSRADSARLAQRDWHAWGVFDVSYEARTRRVIVTDVMMSDGGGKFLDVFDVDAEGFSGRWEDGGMFFAAIRRAGVPVHERESGYFCAQRAR